MSINIDVSMSIENFAIHISRSMVVCYVELYLLSMGHHG